MIVASFDILRRFLYYFQTAGTLSVLAWLWPIAVLAVFAWRLRRAWLACLSAVMIGVGLLLACVLAGPMAIVAWALLVAAVAALWRHAGRTRICLATVAVALVGFGLGELNSSAISEIQVDRSEELLKAQRRQEEQRAEDVDRLKSASVDINFAEDSELDRLDLAGKTADEADLLLGAASRPATPGYQRRGKQQRDPTKSRAGASEFDQLAPAAATAVGRRRRMKAWDIIGADRLDRVNLFAVRFGLLTALLALGVDYLSRFNLAFGAALPVPIAGRFVDAFFPKSHVVHVETADEAAVRGFLETTARKGETYIYMGPSDPFAQVPPAGPALDLPATVLRRRGEAARLQRLPLGIWPLRHVVVGAGDGFPDDGFIFESAWFGRYGFAVVGADRSCALLAAVREHLKVRRIPRASARRSVNLIWRLGDAPEALAELAWLCRETNFRLVVFSVRPAAPATAGIFDEHVKL